MPPSSPTVAGAAGGNPIGGEISRYTEKSKISTRTLHYQTVTNISFNPAHALSISFSGPGCRMEYRKILPGQEMEQHPDTDFATVKQLIGEDCNVMGHSWSADGELVAICTDDAKLVVYRIEDDEVILSEAFDPNKVGSLIDVYLFELGLVTASQDGHMFFYELGADGDFT